MTRILITGATGNIGREVIHYLNQSDGQHEVIAAVRNLEKAKQSFSDYPQLDCRYFDFDDQRSFADAFSAVDQLFLLRPPHISEVEQYFGPLLRAAMDKGIKRIVFLSVQGAERSKVIPHNQIEELIKKHGFSYIFLRPSYFMQNLTTTLLPEIREKRSITLPSGKALFNWIDARNIGEAAAVVINSFERYQDQALELTGSENKSFGEAAQIMSEILDYEISYRSINPVRFYFRKRREGLVKGMAVVMTILHFLPRLQKPPQISDNYTRLTGKQPTGLAEFIRREQHLFNRESE